MFEKNVKERAKAKGKEKILWDRSKAKQSKPNEAEPKTQSNGRDGQFIMALWHMIRILFSELPARIVLIKCVRVCLCVIMSHS